MMPVIEDPYGMQAGYFLNGSEYDDVAVLWMKYEMPIQLDFKIPPVSFWTWPGPQIEQS
jgi:hypothetical protein